MSEKISAAVLDSFALSDIAHVEMGQSPDSQYVVEDPFKGIAFLQGNAEFGAVYPEPKFGCLRPAKQCNTNDVLISVRAPVGAINIADRDYCIGRGLAAIRGRGIKPSLLGEVVARHSPALRRVAQGTTFEAINKKDLLTLNLSLPSKTDWPQIAQILDTLDTAIHETEAIIAKLKAVKQGLLHDLLTRGINANGELRPPQAEAPHLYKQSSLGWIPKEWEATNLGLVTTWVSGGTPNRAIASNWIGDVPLLTPKDMKVFELSDTSEHISLGAAQSGSRLMPSETVFIVVRGMILAHSFPVMLATVAMAFNQDIKAVSPVPRMNIRFLAHWFVANSDRFLRKVTEATHGTKKLDMENLLGMPIGVPPLDEQDGIVARQKAFDDRLENEALSLSKLRILKSGLMDDILTGRVRVTPLLDESAP